MKSFDYVARQKQPHLLIDDGMQKERKYLRQCSQGFKVILVEDNFPKAAEAWNHGMSSGITTAGCVLTHVVRQSDLFGDLMSRHETMGNTTNNPRMILNKETAT